ncbi:MAG: hypothetical protein JO076_07305 [Verrucomicrobia bacterium]|nr:hypothetical protein [Verrucomicrobiota bacterium]
MKKWIVTLIISACSGVTFAGAPIQSLKNPVAPPPPAPTSFFRSNEWSLGAFATYNYTIDNSPSQRIVGSHSWGGGLSVNYFPWLYAGFRIKGAVFNTIPKDDTGEDVSLDFLLRYPLDLIKPNLHLAPYAYGGIGGVFVSEDNFFSDRFFRYNRFHNNDDQRVLGDFGGGLEYRFTRLIGIFAECGYNVVDGPKNNYLQTNFGLKFAF